MKKAIYILTMLAAVTLTACDKDEPGGTALESASGEWYVTVDCVDDDGNVVYSGDEFFGIGKFHLLTYNTNANTTTEMYVDDLDNFWGFRVKVNVDLSTLTFSTDGYVDDIAYYYGGVYITDGKIVKDGGVQNNGSADDYIEFYVTFDDDPGYPEYYGFAKYKVSGVRYSGLTEND